MVVTLYDILNIQGGHIHHSEGAASFLVTFRVVVFRPFAGEVLTGVLHKSTPEGIHVALGEFFQDIFVPETYIQVPR